MRARDCFLYLLGHRNSIRAVASGRAALGTGIVLVLLTAIARNHDQTFIGESPFLWLFGSLIFSFVSGAWLYMISYGLARRWMPSEADGKRPAFWSGWRSFLGLFWMTAPIAWLYAIPVERFLDSVSAAHANVVLLSVVSLWRVLLMARVWSVLVRAPMILTLCWVLFPAAVEVLGATIFGGTFSNRVIASMGGMRNSPEEEILLNAMGAAFTGALLVAPFALVVALAWRPKVDPTPLPRLEPGALPWSLLAVATVFWMAAAIAPQVELSRTVQVEERIRQGQWRAALDYLSRHQPGDFAPARTLPPKPYERDLFDMLPPLIGAAQGTDPPWVRAHLFRRLNEMVQQIGPRWMRHRKPNLPWDKQVEQVERGLDWIRPSPSDWARMLGSLAALPDGRAWLSTNGVLLEGMARSVAIEPWTNERRSHGTEAEWRTLAVTLRDLGATNAVLTNLVQRADTTSQSSTNLRP